MPRKSRRVAAKQAELGQKKRRASKHHAGVEASLPAAREGVPVGAAASSTATATRQETAAPAVSAGTPEATRPAPADRRAPAAATRTHNPYVWPEIKRIGVITGLMIVILAVLTVVLG